MFTGLTRQEQRTLLLLLTVVVGGMGVQQWRDQRHSSGLMIDSGGSGASASSSLPLPVSPEESLEEVSDQRLVDLNTATVTELITLPMIGERTAEAIIADRQVNGAFRSVDDLMRVGGIGERTLARLRPHITVSDAPPAAEPSAQPRESDPPVPDRAPPASSPRLINVNTGDLEALMTLDGIGEVKAQRIVAHRRVHGSFRRPEDLLGVEGIGPVTVERNRSRLQF